MPKKETKWEHELIDYARTYKWKVYHIETFKQDGGATIRRFAFVKKGLPTIKVMFADDAIVGATQWYYGRIVNRKNRGSRIASVGTMKKWMREVAY